MKYKNQTGMGLILIILIVFAAVALFAVVFKTSMMSNTAPVATPTPTLTPSSQLDMDQMENELNSMEIKSSDDETTTLDASSSSL
jgi:hypothetical protein